MKRVIILCAILASFSNAYSQSYIGYLTDNYSGVHGVISNPANIADSRFKADINLISVSTLEGNDYFGINVFDAMKSNYDFDEDGRTFPKDENNFFGNIDVMGPSFMFNITPKHSVAIFTRARSFININKIDGTLFDNLSDDFEEEEDFVTENNNVFVTLNGWAEIGASYATILYDRDQHFIKGGVSVKYLQGFGNAYGSTNNLSINYDADGIETSPGNTTGSLESSGSLTYGRSDNLNEDMDNFEMVDGATGIGFDLGFVYELRKPEYSDNTNDYTKDRDKNKYILKLGISVTDIGSIKYKNGEEEVYDLTNTINQDTYENADDIDDLLDLYTLVSEGESTNAALPTALHVNADWSMSNKFYLNLNTDLSLRSAEKLNANRFINTVSLTPRLETKWFSFYSPLSLIQHSGFSWGAGLRAGPLFVGSGSILSNLISDESKRADIYLGLKVPLYHKPVRDNDEDGILNKHDNCPNEAGPIENNGCPWPDSDGDSILDKDDNCPEEAGEIENEGCPWPDTDLDGILDKDDNCPEEAGEVENDGCPWPDTDEDGVLDKDDACPEMAGTIANKGCPEVTEEVIKKLNDFAKIILFNSGRATFKEESLPILEAMAAIFKEYPSARFKIEGHTDSVGSESLNQRLSDERSNAVMEYLVSKGIEASRLSAQGFGETKPKFSNDTREGRARNRRVEIILDK